MKRAIVAAALMVAGVILLAGCATSYPVGMIYTEVGLPIVATSNGTAAPKVGTAECKSILALVAIGDASIDAAKKDAGITKVYHVDWHAENILGIIGKYKCTVYGE